MSDEGFAVEPPEIAAAVDVIDKHGKVGTQRFALSSANARKSPFLNVSRVQSLPGEYLSLYRNLADVILHGVEPAVKWHQAAQVIELIELTHKSAKELRTLDVPLLKY